MNARTVSLIALATLLAVTTGAVTQCAVGSSRLAALQGEHAQMARALAETQQRLARLQAEHADLLARSSAGPAASVPASGSAGFKPAERERLSRLFSGATTGSNKLGAGGGRNLKEGLARQVDRDMAGLVARLDLTADQQRRIRPLLQDHADRSSALVAQLVVGRMSPTELQRLATDRLDLNRSIRAELTASQQARFDADLAAAKPQPVAPSAAAPPPAATATSPEFQQRLTSILAAHKAAAAARAASAASTP